MDDKGRAPQIPWLVLLVAVLSACATPRIQPTLTLEQHSLRIPLTVEADGGVLLAEHPPLIGRIDLSSILRAEGVPADRPARTTVQLMMHYGRLYVVADAFHAIWEITPRPGTAAASFRPIRLVPESSQERLTAVRLSRYGASQSTCLRLDRAGAAAVFITPEGEVRDDCP